MKAEYDFSKAKRARDVPHLAKLQDAASKGKTRVTMYLDDEVLVLFVQMPKARVRATKRSLTIPYGKLLPRKTLPSRLKICGR